MPPASALAEGIFKRENSQRYNPRWHRRSGVQLRNISPAVLVWFW
jgi:hypothetical protein